MPSEFVLSMRVSPILDVEVRRTAAIVVVTTGFVVATPFVITVNGGPFVLKLVLAAAYLGALFVSGAVDKRELRLGRRVFERFV